MKIHKNIIHTDHKVLTIHTIVIIAGGSRSKMQTHYLTNSQKDIEKVDLYAKDPYEEKYQCLINIHEGVGLKH